MPDALRIGVLGPLQVRDGAGHTALIGGRQLRVLLILLALDAGRVVPAGSLAEQLWPDEAPGHPGNALQTLVSRLRAELRRAGFGQVIESHPAGCHAAEVAAARLTELHASVLADRIEADLALGEGASLVGEVRALTSADPTAERPRALLMRALYAAGRQAEALAVYHEARELLAGRLVIDPSAQLEQVYLRILRADPSLYPERSLVSLPVTPAAPKAGQPLTSFVGRDSEVALVLRYLSPRGRPCYSGRLRRQRSRWSGCTGRRCAR
jgi:DNA-binding SARP family transcriptional activator